MSPSQRLSSEGLLGGRSCFRRGFLAVALIEAIDASGRVHQLLFAGEKWMGSRANFHMQVAFFGRTSLKRFPAGAGNCDFAVCWMNFWFHCSLNLTYRQPNTVHFKQAMIGVGCFIVK